MSTPLICLAAWLAFGALSFVFWWTTCHKYEATEIPLTVMAAIMGPLSWWAGWFIHAKHTGRTFFGTKRKVNP